MTKILVPTDFSDISNQGLKLGVDIAKKMDGTITLLNVIYPADGAGFTATGDVNTSLQGESAHFMAALVRKNTSRLEKLIENYQDEGVEIIPQIDFEKRVHGLKSFAEENAMDMIVIGTSGHKSLAEYFAGTKTENVVKASSCPVISVKGEVENFNLKNIVMAVDLQDYNDEDIRSVKGFVENFDCQVHFLHVLDNDLEADDAMARLKSIAENHEFPDFTINTIENKDTADAIMRYTKRHSADMIGLFAEGKKGLKDLIYGSVTNDIINKIEVPVLIIPKK